MSVHTIGFELFDKTNGKQTFSFYYDGKEFHLKGDLKITDAEDFQELIGKMQRYFAEAPELFEHYNQIENLDNCTNAALQVFERYILPALPDELKTICEKKN